MENHTDPSGQYVLIVQHSDHTTSGTVRKVKTDEPIITINRKWDSFDHSWWFHGDKVYLQTGYDPFSEILVDLDNGKIIELKKTGNFKPGNFCWVKSYLSPDGTTLGVFGCVWAAPYEFIFYNITSPDFGLEILNSDKPYEEYVDIHNTSLYVNSDLCVWDTDGCFEMKFSNSYFKVGGKYFDTEDLSVFTYANNIFTDDDDYDPESDWYENPVDIIHVIRKIRRVGNKIELVSEENYDIDLLKATRYDNKAILYSGEAN